MALLFDFYAAPPREGEEGKPQIYARPVVTRTVTTRELTADIQKATSLTNTDVAAALYSLSQTMARYLQHGEQVHLEGIGYFSVSLKCSDINTVKDMRADHVSVKSINFRADADLRAGVMNAKIERRRSTHSQSISNEEVDRRVANYFKTHQVMTRSDLQAICSVKAGIAFKHIRRLLEEKKIKNINSKQHPIYVAG